jgi:hypothetical protein
MAAARFEATSIKPQDPSKPPMTEILYRGGSEMYAGARRRESQRDSDQGHSDQAPPTAILLAPLFLKLSRKRCDWS